jgi:hypothetical protein
MPSACPFSMANLSYWPHEHLIMSWILLCNSPLISYNFMRSHWCRTTDSNIKLFFKRCRKARRGKVPNGCSLPPSGHQLDLASSRASYYEFTLSVRFAIGLLQFCIKLTVCKKIVSFLSLEKKDGPLKKNFK